MVAHKHFTLNDRILIKEMLDKRQSFKEIGKALNKDCTTISKEIRNHRIFKKVGAYGRPFNNCIHNRSCIETKVCNVCTHKSHRSCHFCPECRSSCELFQEEKCSLLNKPPYICNGCVHIRQCTLEKSIYDPDYANKEYMTVRSESRSGISINETEAKRLDDFISPLILQGQSIHHICSNNADTIMCSERTIYNYVDYCIFSARNLDLPRKPGMKFHARKSNHSRFKIDKKCRIGRTYNDFLAYMAENPDTPIVQIDSVDGAKGGKVLLTIHFVSSEFMLAFLRDANDSQSVIDIFNHLYTELSPDIFKKIFPLLLGDNGSEFSNPSAIEFDSYGEQRTRMFYCDPNAPFQKGAAENNHELIRRIIPKGRSFNYLCQDDIDLMMNHINSYGRKKLGDKSPYKAFTFIYGEDVLKKLGCRMIPSNKIILQPSLLNK
jgi:IS30 family transposase